MPRPLAIEVCQSSDIIRLPGDLTESFIFYRDPKIQWEVRAVGQFSDIIRLPREVKREVNRAVR